ncbi:hypothetical protein H5U98_21980 [Mycolicibacterium boenickei]|uniref:DUF6199 domain-containing protein n=1 Tax=Mycolicibacterium boenickei TaxID=146017 RepID=A0AAX2ZS25_9MYCO|nr:DUF6199 family natural product biosynthesis protein [Mycolicibacterium boenickei]PEG58028.1 hypothetical protein CQY21_24400 [Mycolicibacterium boenickei]UNB98205.1 hypothetical protein H5U98_21980 [Mycolicibacterium boenickei]
MGVLVGGVMVAGPKGIWWATQSWKFRHPEANEPSDLSYGMTRASGVLLICLALVMGSVVISDSLSMSAAEKREQEAEAQQKAAEKGVQLDDGTSSSQPPGGCQVVPALSRLGTSTVTVNVKLRWSDAGGGPDADKAGCRTGSPEVRAMTSRWGKITDGTTVLTDGPIADKAGTEVSGVGPGNRVPRS